MQNRMMLLSMHSINVSWKQLVAYFLFGCCGQYDLTDIIISTIFKLFNISLNVKVFISDQGSNFVRFS